MKKILMSLVVLALMATPSFAASDNVVEGMAQKAVRGVVDIVSSPIELPHQIIKGFQGGFDPIENEGGSKLVGTVLGFFRGVSHTAGRLLSGVTDLAGFWAANPESNEGVGVPFDAEYSWEMGEQYSIFDPSFEEGVKPIGRKLGHGISNGLLGILELPGQIKKGIEEGNPVGGIVKGFWYAMSREVYGLSSVYGALVPNHEDTKGYAFDEEWPWEALTE